MQFDDNDLEKNNDGFSLDDNSNSISWDDLLSSDDIDMSGLVKSDGVEDAKAGKNTSSILDADISSYSDDSPDVDLDLDLDIDSNAVPASPPPAPAYDFSDLDAAAKKAKNQEAELSESESVYTVQNGPEEYVDTSNTDAISIDTIVSSGAAAAMAPKPAPDVNKTTDRFNFGTEDESAAGNTPEDLSNDQELLDILNDKQTVDIPDPEPEKPAYQQNQHAYKKPENQLPPPAAEDFQPAPQKKKAPVLLIAGFALVVVLAIVFFALTSGLAPSTDKEVAMEPVAPVTSLRRENVQEPAEKIDNTDAKPLSQEVAEGAEAVKSAKAEAKKSKDSKGTAKKEEKPAKKEIIAVKFSGRTNPFVPSAMLDESGFANFGADISSPPDILPNLPAAVAARKLLTIAVSGIMYDPAKPSAILRFNSADYFVQKGDKIDSYTVGEITKDYVVIANGANTFKAYVGENFKTDSSIPESSMMTYDGANRQYVSAGDISVDQTSSKSKSSNRRKIQIDEI